MYYYELAPATMTYHGAEALTYHHAAILQPGQLAIAAVRGRTSVSIILRKVAKPEFKTAPITHVFTDIVLPKSSLELLTWLRAYYPGPLSSHAQLFTPPALTARTRLLSSTHKTQPLAEPQNHAPALTKEQTHVLTATQQPGTFYLHGETGSGKTRIYEELAKQTLAKRKSVLILTPEIGLTPQLIRSFTKIFGGGRVIALHSGMTEAARRKAWLAIQGDSRGLIVIGPRSALFSPIADLGLIVIDEAHEFTYKQENSPHYHAVRVAAILGNITHSIVIFGSATPSVSDYFAASMGRTPILRMRERPLARHAAAASVSLIDMRQADEQTSTSFLSATLLRHIKDTLQRGEQSLLFINRRGSARIMLCSRCGWQAVCPHCDLPLTYHHDTHVLRCHVCNFIKTAPVTCPDCGNVDITLKSLGSKLVAESVQRLFPSSRVARFDTDNLTGERLVDQYEAVSQGAIDILIGTQLLAKGLDLPKLSLVGVLNADAGLYIPDFSASERSYALLHQLIGRVGRGHRSGAAILQTYTPDSPILAAAASQSWETFYEAELAERKLFNFPPFVHLLKVSCARATSQNAEKNAHAVADTLARSGLRISIDGPAPAFHEKRAGKYTWHLIIKAKQRNQLLEAIKLLPRDWSFDIDPLNIL